MSAGTPRPDLAATAADLSANAAGVGASEAVGQKHSVGVGRDRAIFSGVQGVNRDLPRYVAVHGPHGQHVAAGTWRDERATASGTTIGFVFSSGQNVDSWFAWCHVEEAEWFLVVRIGGVRGTRSSSGWTARVTGGG